MMTLKTAKTFHFSLPHQHNGDVRQVEVIVPELADPQYGMFTWPCAPVLAQYIFWNQRWLIGKRVLELGAGTALPGVLAACLGAKVTLSDSAKIPDALSSCARTVQANATRLKAPVEMAAITWGEVNEAMVGLTPVDIILASDCFYDKKDFEDILFTVSLILERNPSAVFVTSYQIRSSSYMIQDLLRKWSLTCREIPLESFDALDRQWTDAPQPCHTIILLEMRRRFAGHSGDTEFSCS